MPGIFRSEMIRSYCSFWMLRQATLPLTATSGGQSFATSTATTYRTDDCDGTVVAATE